MSKFKRIEIIVPEHVAKQWEDLLPQKRAIKKIVDDPQADIRITGGLVGSRREF